MCKGRSYDMICKVWQFLVLVNIVIHNIKWPYFYEKLYVCKLSLFNYGKTNCNTNTKVKYEPSNFCLFI